jgi:hypothetical protein
MYANADGAGFCAGIQMGKAECIIVFGCSMQFFFFTRAIT